MTADPDTRDDNGLTPTESQVWGMHHRAITDMLDAAVLTAPSFEEASRRLYIIRLEVAERIGALTVAKAAGGGW